MPKQREEPENAETTESAERSDHTNHLRNLANTLNAEETRRSNRLMSGVTYEATLREVGPDGVGYVQVEGLEKMQAFSCDQTPGAQALLEGTTLSDFGQCNGRKVNVVLKPYDQKPWELCLDRIVGYVKGRDGPGR